MKWEEQGLSPHFLEKLQKWIEFIGCQGLHQDLMPIIQELIQRLPTLQHNLFDLIMDLPDDFLKERPQLSAKIASYVLNEKIEKKDSLHVVTKLKNLVGVLLEAPRRQEYYSSALDLLEKNLDDGILQTQEICNHFTAIDSPDLQLRFWKILKIRFHHFLTCAEEDAPPQDTVLKIMNVSYRILRLMVERKHQPLAVELDDCIEFYNENAGSLEEWIKTRKSLILNDMEHLLTSRSKLMKSANPTLDNLKSFLTFRTSVFKLKNTKKSNLQSNDEDLASTLFKQNAPALFLEGCRIFKKVEEASSKNTPRFIDLMVEMIENSAPLKGTDKVAFDFILPEIYTIIIDNSRKISPEDFKRINLALLELPEVKDVDETTLPQHKRDMLKFIRNRIGVQKLDDLDLVEVPDPYKPIYIGRLIIGYKLIRLFKILAITAVVLYLFKRYHNHGEQ